MITREDVKNMEEGIQELEDMLDALPSFIFILKIHLAQGKRQAGLTEPVLQPVDAPLIEAAVG